MARDEEEAEWYIKVSLRVGSFFFPDDLGVKRHCVI